MSKHILNKIIQDLTQQIATQKTTPVVFDLDSTLFDVSGRNQVILNEYWESPACEQIFEAPSAKPKKTPTVLQGDWGPLATLRRLGLNPTEEQARKLHAFWADRFFSPEYFEHDQPMAGSAEFTQALAEMGVKVHYLTGRSSKRLNDVTQQLLRKFNFATGPIQLKDDGSLPDSQYKLQWVIDHLPRLSKPIYFFENEPAILHKIIQSRPGLIAPVWLDTAHSGQAVPSESWLRIQNFVR